MWPMNERVLKPVTTPLTGSLNIPGDKSISHRSIILGALARGTTKVSNFLLSEDCEHTIDAFKALGVQIKTKGSNVEILSNGYLHFKEAKTPLYFGNSGTTARLLIGLLASLPLFTTIYGDPYLTERPMDRVVNPLRKMGATISGRGGGSRLPIAIDGKSLESIEYTLPVQSAQVKSALLLAGLFAEGQTTIIEDGMTRDHTERMLEAFGVPLSINKGHITIDPIDQLEATDIHVPGDISSAAFFIVAGALVLDSEITLQGVGLNETRTGILDVMEQMGAQITIENKQVLNGEPFGDLIIKQVPLHSTEIGGHIIPRLIDELPVIALLATQAKGRTVIKDAEELRVKETDRIAATVDILTKLGANIEETEDGMIIEGPTPLQGNSVNAYYDHRMAMMIAVASLITSSPVHLDDDSSINISYPQFFEHLNEFM